MDSDHASEDSEEQKDLYLVQAAYNYITMKIYPPGCSRDMKRSIRRKSEKFVLVDGEMFFKKKKSRNVKKVKLY